MSSKRKKDVGIRTLAEARAARGLKPLKRWPSLVGELVPLKDLKAKRKRK